MNMRLFLRLFGLCACSAFFAAPSFSQIVVGELRCENLKDPLGIDCAVPRVSWRVEPGKRGLAQSAYQIGVFEVHVNGGHEPKLLWDSGKVESSDSHLIPLDQVKLSSGMECQWMVRIWDTQGEASEWSAPARFTVGPADRPEAGIQDWEGRWIGVDWIHEHQGPLPLMRHAFDLAEKPVRAYAHVCALGYYELYLNGEKIGEEVLSPAVSDYSKRGLYLTHDVTDHLQAGENCVGIWLGRGWSTGVLGLLTDRGPVVKAQLELVFADGTRKKVVTDASWKTAKSHITPIGKGMSGGYGGEHVDAVKEITGWSRAGFDASGWQDVTVYDFDGEKGPRIEAQMMEPNRLLDEITPASVKRHGDGYLVDMGRNYTGWFMLRFPDELKSGTEVHMEFADKQFPDGRFQTYSQQDTYMAKGGGGESFCNRFNYHAFRYAILKGLPREPKLEEISGRMISTGYDHAAEFSCDNSLLNDIYNTTIWTHQCLSLGGYTVDCPHRERLGYGGDSGTSMEAAMLNFKSNPFYAKWAEDWRLSQGADGDVPYTAPNSQEAGGGPVWSGFCITMPWMVYTSYGDLRILEKNWPMMKGWLKFIDTKMEDELLRPYVGIGNSLATWSFLGDWVPPGRKQGKDRVDDLSTLFFNNCYLVHCLQLASKVAVLMGEPETAKEYADKAAHLAKTLHERFLNEDGVTYANGEQTYLAMPLLFGITPPDKRAGVFSALEKDIVETRDGHLNTGMHGNYYMARLLLRERRNDLLTLMHTKETYPSYGFMLKNGATTIWEEWDGDNSQIHNTMISVGMWFIAGLGGIQLDEAHPGFKHFTLAPGLESGLSMVRAVHHSPYGQILSAWKKDETGLEYLAEVPPNSTASLVLPAASIDAVKESGLPLEESSGITNIRVQEGLLYCDLAAGNYHFQIG